MGKINLRDYQDATLDAVREMFRLGERVVMLYAPTGAGKTEMAIALMAAAKEKSKRSAMILDRIVLCDQTSARLQRYNIDHGVMQSGHWRNRPYELIQVCSAQTLEKRGSFPGLNLMIVDEAHATRRQTVEFIKNNPNVFVVGLSASPFAKGLAQIYARKVVSVTTTKALVEKGNLVPLRVFICQEVNMGDQKPKVAGEWSVDQVEDAGMKITGDVVAEWESKCREVFGGPRKTIVFCASVAHGADLQKKFAEAGYNFVQISYEDTDDFKKEAVKDFSKPDTAIHGLIACDILTKGFDVPDVMVGVSVRPFKKSFSSHVQQMGRPMRPHPEDGIVTDPPREKVKPFALWLCFSGNYLRFQDKWDDLYENGMHELKDEGEKAVEERTAKEKERAKCPKCGALWAGRGRVCASCGHERPIFSDIIEVPGQMVELGENAKATAKAQKQWWKEMRTIIRGRGKDDALLAMVFKDKFGKWPPYGWRDEAFQAVPVSPEVVGFDKHRRIAWAKGKQRRAA